MSSCINCNSDLSADIIALNMKLNGRSIKRFLCIDCLADYFKVDKEILENKISEYKESGCKLFDNPK